MASHDTGPAAADGPGAIGLHYDPDMQPATSTAEQDALGTKRAHLLRRMCILAVVTLIVSVVSIIVGLLAITDSESELYPFQIAGVMVAAGMAALLTLCPFCLFFEGKKTPTGNYMTMDFLCCICLMTVWYTFTMIGILYGLGFSGIWGLIKCVQAEHKTGFIATNTCLENTDTKLALFAVLLTLLSALMILTMAIFCTFSCNNNVFGYKNGLCREKQYETCSNAERHEMEQEMTGLEIHDQRSRPRPYAGRFHDQRSSPRPPDYHRSREPSAPPLPRENKDRDDQRSSPRLPTESRRNRNGDYHRSREPSAPTLTVYNTDSDRRSRRHSPRLSPNEQYHTRDTSDTHRPRSPRRSREDRRERNREVEGENEAPPPSYDEVVKNELQKHDV